MIKQPWGCLLALLILIGTPCVVGGLCFLICSFGIFGASVEPSLVAVVVGLLTLPFSFIGLDYAHMLEIRYFCKKHGLQVKKIKIHRNHYGVEYFENGEKKYGRWPKDFMAYEEQKP